MPRGQRKPDTIGDQLEDDLQREVARIKEDFLLHIMNSRLFGDLTQSAKGAKKADNEQLARALCEAKLTNFSIIGIVQDYARRFIYPERSARPPANKK